MINESWKDDPIIKFGTSLYSLKPIGLGTWYVESLTSYITRLARAHSLSVSNLVYNVLLRIEQGARKHSSFFVKSKKFLSDSPTTNKLISVLEELNGVDSIEFLTTKKWDFGSQNKQVFDNFKKWCPVCYYNMYKHEKNGCGEIYEPLIWFFKDIEYCPIHEVPLESQCPYCRSKNRHIDKNSRCGFCSKCNAFLGLEEVKINNLDKDKEWHKSAISNISSLIIQLQSDNHRPKHNWNSNIEKIVYTLFGNSVYRFCKQVGLGTSGYRWLHGQSPHLEGLLRVSHICNIPIEKLIYDNLDIREDHPIKTARLSKNSRNKLNHEHIEQELNELLRSPNVPTLINISKSIGISPRYLKKRYPLLCFELSAKRKQEIEIAKIKERNIIIDGIKTAVYRMHASGLCPSIKGVSKICGFSKWRLTDIDFRRAYDEAVAEVQSES